MLNKPSHEEILPDVQTEPALAQLQTMSFHPVTVRLRENNNPHLATASCQAVAVSDEVIPEPPSLHV